MRTAILLALLLSDPGFATAAATGHRTPPRGIDAAPALFEAFHRPTNTTVVGLNKLRFDPPYGHHCEPLLLAEFVQRGHDPRKVTTVKLGFVANGHAGQALRVVADAQPYELGPLALMRFEKGNDCRPPIRTYGVEIDRDTYVAIARAQHLEMSIGEVAVPLAAQHHAGLRLLAARLADESPSPCPMQPVWRALDLPDHGFVPLSTQESGDRCDPVPASDWTRQGTLFVHTLGPEGSGRYWDVTLALDERAPPERGLCLTTSTVGWRTLQRHDALTWLDDLDGDGRAEFILWDSFGLNGSESPAEQALIAWVYRPTSSTTLELDETLSRAQARALATAYRAPLESPDARLQTLRDDAARALQAFAEQRCVP